MSDFKVVDKKGAWLINTGETRIPDYIRQAENPGEELVILEPGVPTRIVHSDFLKGQPVVREIEDPTTSEGIVFKEPKAEAAAAPAAPAAPKDPK